MPRSRTSSSLGAVRAYPWQSWHATVSRFTSRTTYIAGTTSSFSAVLNPIRDASPKHTGHCRCAGATSFSSGIRAMCAGSSGRRGGSAFSVHAWVALASKAHRSRPQALGKERAGSACPPSKGANELGESLHVDSFANAKDHVADRYADDRVVSARPNLSRDYRQGHLLESDPRASPKPLAPKP